MAVSPAIVIARHFYLNDDSHQFVHKQDLLRKYLQRQGFEGAGIQETHKAACSAQN